MRPGRCDAYVPAVLRVVQASAAEARVNCAGAVLQGLEQDARGLLLCAGREPAMDTLRALTRGRGALLGLRQLRLHHLAAELARPVLFREGLAPLPALGVVAICARLIAQFGAEGQLARFTPVESQPGLPLALARTLGELRMADLDAGAVEAHDPALGQLLRGYEAMLSARGLEDPAGILRRAHGALTDAELPQAVVALDVPVHHRLEARLLAGLCAAAPQGLITCPTGDQRCLRLISEQAPEAPALEVLPDAGPGRMGPLARVRAHLFTSAAAGGPESPPSSARSRPEPSAETDAARPADTDAGAETDADAEAAELAFLSAPGEGRECVELARRLLWETERGTPFEQMAILCQAATQYHVHLAEALRRAGIPAHFAAGNTRPDPAGRALLALLACAEEDLSARRFAEYLSLGVVPQRQRGGAPPDATDASDRIVSMMDAEEDVVDVADLVDVADASASRAAAADAHGMQELPDPTPCQPRAWEQALQDAAVIGGRARWARRLGALSESLGTRAPDQMEEAHRRAQAARRAQLADLSAYALPLIEALDALPEHARWGEWAEALGALSTRAIRRPARVLGVLAELAPMADLGPVTLAEVRRVLSGRLTELHSPAAADRGGRVFVGTPAQARGMAFDVVCIPGLAERIFPQKVREDPMLLDDLRRALDAGLATQRDGVEAERLALRIAVGAARKRLVLSYPRIDPERGRPRVPSFYGLELLRAAEGALPGYDALIARAEKETAARVGWPAPSDGQQAIDAAEHDLSLLQTLVDARPEQTVGAARYLLGQNAHLARSLRFRARRWNVRRLTPADGLVAPGPGAAAALATHRLSARPYSASALQHFAACPYRFVLHAIHNLSPERRPAPLEQLDAAQRGQLMHDTQYRVLSALRDGNALPVTEAGLPDALQLLAHTIEAVADEMRELLAPAIERIFDDGVAKVHGDLRQWLRQAVHADGWLPTHFEWSFGVPVGDAGGNGPGRSQDPQSVPEALALDCGIRLRGAIDVVERRGRALRAVDHKSGGRPGARAGGPPEGQADAMVIGGGRTLQPLLYALALRAAFPGAEVEGGQLYYCTARGGYERRRVALDARAEAAAALVAETVDGALQEGMLPALPAEGACEHCDYRVVCGPYEAQRTARKDSSGLRALAQLRASR